jgi:hypothetical protein
MIIGLVVFECIFSDCAAVWILLSEVPEGKILACPKCHRLMEQGFARLNP